MELKRRMLVVLLLASVVLTGCSGLKQAVLYPIEQTDVFIMEKGAKVLHLNKTETEVIKDGLFVSDFYVKEVMRARIGE